MSLTLSHSERVSPVRSLSTENLNTERSHSTSMGHGGCVLLTQTSLHAMGRIDARPLQTLPLEWSKGVDPVCGRWIGPGEEALSKRKELLYGLA